MTVFPINIGKTFSFLFVADRIDFIVNEMHKNVNHRIRLLIIDDLLLEKFYDYNSFLILAASARIGSLFTKTCCLLMMDKTCAI